MKFPDYKTETACIAQGFEYVVGCDEVGRGPLAGPVVAGACVLDKNSIGEEREGSWHERVRDSKLIKEEEREILAQEIFKNSLAWGIGEVSPEEIDEINIHRASLLAMRKAVENLLVKMQRNTPSRSRRIVTLVDGKFTIPGLDIEQKNIIDGDAKILSIATASIIAKVHRDEIMKDLDKKFPGYGFAKHKGYGTNEHYRSIQKFGISPVHRRSFV